MNNKGNLGIGEANPASPFSSLREKLSMAWIGFGLFLALGLLVGIAMPFQPQLNALGHRVLMALLITIGFWIFKPAGISYAASGSLFMAVLLALGFKAGTVFTGFTSTAVWSLIPALFFGFVLSKTGLGKRIAYLGMKSTKLSYPGILIMWAVIGVVLSILTPSITVRVVIVIPIAMNCVELCGLKQGSKGRSLILLTAWAMALIPGTGWSTGSLAGPIISGLYAGVAELGPIAFNNWFKIVMLPAALISVIMLVAGYYVLRPSEPLSISKDTFAEEYLKLGYMSINEKISGSILLIAFAFLATSSVHRIPDAAICLTALFALVATGTIKTPEISSGISWDLVMFFGVAMSLSTVFVASGVSKWLSTVLVPLFEPLAGNPWLFVFVVMTALFLWRFIDIALLIPTMAILVPILPQIAAATGVNPQVWVSLFCIALNSCFLGYQNMFALVAEANMQGKGWTAGHLTRYGVLYFIASLVSLLVAVPYWISIGMFV